MKIPVVFILLFLALAAPAATPSFQSFDPATFSTNNYIIRLQAAVSNQWRIDATNIATSIAGQSFNPTNLALYGTTTNMNGDFAVRSNKMFRFDLADGTWTGNSIWWDQAHPARGEMHLDGEQFSFNDGLSLQKTAFSHFGSSVDSQGIWVFNHEGSATGTRTNSPSKQLGFSSQYWNGSASVVLLFGPRFWPGDTTGTNWTLEWRVFNTSKVNRAGGSNNDVSSTNYHIMNQFGYGARQNAYSRPSFFNMNAPSNGVYFQTSQGDEVGLATENVRRLYVIDDSVTVADASFQAGSGGGSQREFTVDYVNHFVEVGKQSGNASDSTVFRVRDNAGIEIFKVTSAIKVANLNAHLTVSNTTVDAYLTVSGGIITNGNMVLFDRTNTSPPATLVKSFLATDTNALGALFWGSNGVWRSINLVGSPTILTNDLVMNQPYTNTTWADLQVSIGTDSSSGLAAVGLWLDETGDGPWEMTGNVTAFIPNVDPESNTNTLVLLSMPPGSRFMATNLSAPAANAYINPLGTRWVKK